MTPVRTAIASTGGMIASVAGKRKVVRAIHSAFMTVDALSIVVTLQGHFAFVEITFSLYLRWIREYSRIR